MLVVAAVIWPGARSFVRFSNHDTHAPGVCRGVGHANGPPSRVRSLSALPAAGRSPAGCPAGAGRATSLGFGKADFF